MGTLEFGISFLEDDRFMKVLHRAGCVCISVIPDTWEVEMGRLEFKASLGQKNPKLSRPYLKEQARRGGTQLEIPASCQVEAGESGQLSSRQN